MNIITSELLAEFSPLECEAIRSQMEKTPVEQFHTIPERDWLHYRGCGRRFIERLKSHKLVDTHALVLSSRAHRALDMVGVAPEKSAIAEALKNGKLSFESEDKPHQYGLKTHNELLRLVGLPEQKQKVGAWKFDPYTGAKLGA